jgi:antitoxin HicB
VPLDALTAIKVSLYWTLSRATVTRAELARRLGWHREQVDRLFRIGHASRLDQLEAAFDALGHKIDLKIVAAAA